MRIRLEKRLTPSRFMQVATPIASVLLTMALGAIIFQLIGFDGPRAIYETFITPIVASYKWQDVATKAAPLIIIALGLSLGNQAKIWNIGADRRPRLMTAIVSQSVSSSSRSCEMTMTAEPRAARSTIA